MKKILSFLLACLMLVSICAVAFAEEDPAPLSKVKLSKTIIIGNPDDKPAEEFSFTFTTQPKGASVTPSGEDVTQEATLDPVKISFDGTETYSDTTPYSATKSIDSLDFKQLTEDGIHGWIVKEKIPETKTENMTYDTTEYYLVARKTTTDGVPKLEFTISKKNEKGDWEKCEELTFRNTYLKILKEGVTVSNKVLNDKREPVEGLSFKYEMQVDHPVPGTKTGFTYKIYKLINGARETDPVTSDAASYGAPFSVLLQNDQELVIENIPEGAKFNVLQYGQSNYKPEVTYGDYKADGSKDAGTTYSDKPGANIDAPQQSSKTIVAEGFYADFINTFEKVTPTGFIISNLPYIALVIVAGISIVFFFASRKRRENNAD